MICNGCHQEYGIADDLSLGGPSDLEWDANDGRCYGCYLEFMYRMYGGMMEPCFDRDDEPRPKTTLPMDIPF